MYISYHDVHVGDEKAVNAEDHTTLYVEDEPTYSRSKTEYAHREREAQRVSLIKNATVTNKNNQPLQKVTKSLYIVTNLGQLPFMLFT